MPTTQRNRASVSLDVPRLLLKYAASLGIDVAEIGQQVGWDVTNLQNLAGRLSLQKFNALWETVAGQVDDPTFGLHFGEAALNFSGGHILLAVMMNCATLGDALDRFGRYHDLLVEGAAPRLHDDEPRWIFTLEQMKSLDWQYAEAVLAMLSITVSHLTNRQVRPSEVRLAHSRPADISEYQRIFAAPLVFDQPCYALVLDRVALDVPIFMANPALLTVLEQFAQRLLVRLTVTDSWTDRVAEALGKLLLQGEKPRLSTVARSLAISPRQLQNKLQAEGLTYQKLSDAVRRQMAQDCLGQAGLTICDVAFLLGFSEQSAFNHAFKRWTGRTPLDYCKQAEKSLKILPEKAKKSDKEAKEFGEKARDFGE